LIIFYVIANEKPAVKVKTFSEVSGVKIDKNMSAKIDCTHHKLYLQNQKGVTEYSVVLK